MAGNAESLSIDQRELVAVGASVGAGCHPCVKYHIKAAANASVGEQRLLAALTGSDRIAAEAAERMARHSRGVLGVEPTATATPSSRLDDALASFGAALAANDRAAIEEALFAAQAAEASRLQLQEAIETAATVQTNAARIHLREAERLLDRSTDATAEASTTEDSEAAGCGDDCPCHGEEDAEANHEAAA